jgi:hypothetical protein
LIENIKSHFPLSLLILCNNNKIAKAREITQNKTNNPTKPSPGQNTDTERSTTQEKVCEDFVRNVKSQDADNVGCGIGY